MIKIGLDPQEFRILEKNLKSLTDKQRQDVLKRAVEDTANKLKAKVRARVPTKTGNLKSSVSIKQSRPFNPNNPSYDVGFAWPKGAHAHLVELGHYIYKPTFGSNRKRWERTERKSKDNPMLLPTFKANRRFLRDFLKSRLSIDKLVKGFQKQTSRSANRFKKL